MAAEGSELPELPPMSVLDAGGVDALAKFVHEYLEKYDLDISFKLKPKKASAKHCSLDGPGLDGGEVDIPATFDLKSADNTGKPLDHGDEPFEVKITDPDGELLPADLVDNKDGTYKCDYVPKKAGPHKVEVTLAGEPIKGSPKQVNIDPATPDPAFCTADGPGLEHATVGEEAPFTIRAHNKAGMPLKVGGHKFESTLEGPHGKLPVDITDNNDGTYGAKYVPIHEGKSKVNVGIGGKHIKNSPFELEVAKAAGKPDATKSFADGPGVEGGCDTWHPAQFTVHAVDPEGKPVPTGGDPFDVVVTDAKGEEVPVTLKDNGDGTYSGEYQPLRPEPHTVEVVLRRPTEPLFYEHIKDSPFNVKVEPGLDPSKCTAYGPGLESGAVEDTKPTHFTVQARDILGQDIKEGGAPFQAIVKAPDGTDIPAPVTDNKDGTYTVNYEPKVDGPHQVAVELEGKPVAQSPYTVNVKKGADFEHTSIRDFSFVIQARGKDGNPLPYGGEKVELAIVAKDGTPVQGAAIKDATNGTYIGQYTLPGPGEYSISVKITGHEIKGSPFTQVLPS
jgi:filamin